MQLLNYSVPGVIFICIKIFKVMMKGLLRGHIINTGDAYGEGDSERNKYRNVLGS